MLTFDFCKFLLIHLCSEEELPWRPHVGLRILESLNILTKHSSATCHSFGGIERTLLPSWWSTPTSRFFCRLIIVTTFCVLLNSGWADGSEVGALRTLCIFVFPIWIWRGPLNYFLSPKKACKQVHLKIKGEPHCMPFWHYAELVSVKPT